jgi:hypothetical protein
MFHFALRMGNLVHLQSLARLRADLVDLLNRRVATIRGQAAEDERDLPADPSVCATDDDETSRWGPDETWLSLP